MVLDHSLVMDCYLKLDEIVELIYFHFRFTIELCEPAHVKYIEIANFELFSSLPETFKVYISER